MSSNSERNPKRIRTNDYNRSNRTTTSNPFLDDFLDALFIGADSGENLLGTGTLPSGISATDPEAIINEILDSIPTSTESLKSNKKRPAAVLDETVPDPVNLTTTGQTIMNKITDSIPNSREAATSSSRRAADLEVNFNSHIPNSRKLKIPRKRSHLIKEESSTQSHVNNQSSIPAHQLNSIKYHNVDRVVETIDLTGDSMDMEVDEEQTINATVDLLSENDDDNMDIQIDQVDNINAETEEDVAQANESTVTSEISLEESSSSSNSDGSIAREVSHYIVQAEAVVTEAIDSNDDEISDAELLSVSEEEDVESDNEEEEVDELIDSSSDEPPIKIVETSAENNVSVETAMNENFSFEYDFSDDTSIEDDNIENDGAENTTIKDTNDQDVSFEDAHDTFEDFSVENKQNTNIDATSIEDASVENADFENSSVGVVGDAIVGDTIIENSNVDDSSVDDSKAEETNAEEASVEEASVEEASVEDNIVEDSSVEDASVEDNADENSSVEDTIVENVSVENSNTEDTSVQDSNIDDPSNEDTNAEDTSAQDTDIYDASIEDASAATSTNSPNNDNDSDDEDVFYDVEYDDIDEEGNLLSSQRTGSPILSHNSLEEGELAPAMIEEGELLKSKSSSLSPSVPIHVEEGEILGCQTSLLPPSLPANNKEGETISSQSSRSPSTSFTNMEEEEVLDSQINGTQPLASAVIEELEKSHSQTTNSPLSLPIIIEDENLSSSNNTVLRPITKNLIESILEDYWNCEGEEVAVDNEDERSSDTVDDEEIIDQIISQSISELVDCESSISDSDVVEDGIDDNEVMQFSEAMDVNEHIEIEIDIASNQDEEDDKSVDDSESIEDTEMSDDNENIDESEVDELNEDMEADEIVDESQSSDAIEIMDSDATEIMDIDESAEDNKNVELTEAMEVSEDVETSKVVKPSENTDIVESIKAIEVIETCAVIEITETIQVVENTEVSKVAEFSTPTEDIEIGESSIAAVVESDHELQDEDEHSNTEDSPVQEKNIEPPATQPEALPSFHADTQIIPEAWRDEEAKLASEYEISSGMPINVVTALENVTHSNTLKLWWYDAYENFKGTVYLFGKTFDHIHNNYVSCCVIVENIQREIYILPRKFKLYDGESTPESVTIEDVRKELEEKITAKGISNWTMEVCTRKYAFELADIPRETQYVKLSYPFYDYRFPQGTSGDTFSHMFGNSVDILEHFIIKNDIMGPCWLEFKNVKSTSSKQSWCAVEAVVCDSKDLSVMKDEDSKAKMDGPPLNILSLSLETKMNHGTQQNEILAISGFVCPNADINNQESATSLPFERFSITRRVPGANQPREVCLDAEREREKSNIKISLENTEDALLYSFLSKLQVIDADVIVGHNFLGMDLDILLHRMKNFDIYAWSRIGRRRIRKWPRLQSGTGGSGSSTYQEQLVMCGRLVCDTYVGCKDLVRCKSYRLTELALSQLGILREEMTVDKIEEYSQAGTIDTELAKHGSFDAYLSFALMVKLQILPLTKQLTNLSGNLWSRSMRGGRSEKNEYLLLHTFYNNKYICPDKPNLKKKRNIEAIFADDELLELENPEKKRKGANGQAVSYAGGLVLEPKSGFYDRYVLLLDFNSLYPSIMQEYNVCFTTMKREPEESMNYNATEIPNTPSPDTPEGILPRLVGIFVKRRQHVKRLMKDSSLSKSTKMQYDIEQMALKLTANSMYGCLGSSISRFYARPLAMYITSKGREILQSTVELAESMGYDVIYGDTDSVMINTNKVKMSHAKLVGEKLKHSVNQRYKQLEIDIDGFFRHTLLLRKKKYAALLVKEKPDGSGLRELVEVKGLDLVRRDWCDLSHKVSEHVLGLILSDKNREDVINDIHNYLKKTATQIKNSEFELEDFVIQKQLTKAPEEYNKSKSHPHVDVAKDMRRAGISVKAGDTIPYVMCESRGSMDENVYAYNEPRMPDDVRDKKATLDIVWYLSKQILPPVNRLCKPIEGTDLTILANCLGLDTDELVNQRLVNETGKEAEGEGEGEGDFDPDLMLNVDENQYSEADLLTLNCTNCHLQNEYKGPISVVYSDGNKVVSGLTCTSCGQVMNEASVQAQVVLTIREYITKYYDSQYKCNQPWCGYTTRFVSPAEGDLCIIRGCPGSFIREFSERMLYSKLSQLSRLFDIKNVNIESHDISIQVEIQNYIQSNDVFTPIKKVIDEYLNLSGYKYLNLSNMMEDIDM